VNGSAERVIRILVYGLKGEVHVGGKGFNAQRCPFRSGAEFGV